ncbi:head maturation protease, ClpP-related [Mucilaginibacter terrae]|uniref:ATP-dependent Clp protease proteolytic subunit n=1 Tax=Mucilaginibacter terrae TaxID=1955052 RepID=A0ABU3GZA7_9SPHI|nr:head maturation protease, ClpP-related [Mucilaginibacter terrae]MDT3405102.1 ATP-dependent Clp protease protease subunit [Mucilaginibacter terrae]
MYKIYLYDTEQDGIGSGSLSSAYLQQQLVQAAGQDVELHISSAGGSAFDAIAIYDLLKKYQGRVITYIDALAASAASIVAMAGKEVVMSKYALLMIHKPMAGSGGNADELLKDVQMLNTVQQRLAQIYTDKTGLDDVTINSLINAVTWMTADQALALGFIDRIEDYQTAITNSAILQKCTNSAPAVYQRCINKILVNHNNSPKKQMNMHNNDLIEKTTSVLDKMMNFFKKVMNKQTMTDKGALHHTGELDRDTEVFQDEDLSTPAVDDVYTTAEGKQLCIEKGKVKKVEPATEVENEDEEEDMPAAKGKLKPHDVQNQIAALKAKLHAQNALLVEARTSLQNAQVRLKQTHTDIKNEIKSTFTPEGSKRSSKAKAESQPFFAPQSEIAKNAVRQAVSDTK